MRAITVGVVVSAWIAFAAAPAQAAVTTVAPANLGIWQPLLLDATGTDLPPGDGGVSCVTGHAGQPLGVGSARLVTATGHGDGSAALHASAFAGTLLSAISDLSYATYVTQSNGTQVPFIRITVDLNGDGAPDDRLFFEPIYQTGAALGIPAQAPITTGAWQTWNARAGGWWTAGGLAGSTPSAAGVRSLDAIVAAAPQARIVNTNNRNAGVIIASGVVAAANHFDSNVDAFTIDAGAGPTTYDFEPGPPPAVNGTSAIVRTVSGTITVTLPGGSAHAVAALGENVPVGTIIDATRGTAALTTALPAGTTQTAHFFDGAFTVRQARGPNALTDIILRSIRFSRLCGSRARATTAAAAAEGLVAESAATKRKRSKRVVSRLWGDGKGKFRTRGRESAATVRGTRWLTEERCDGTLTRVRRGSVTVKNTRTGKTVVVRAGHSYLARN
jgi:hypothetical protein